jgi:hypothetical protein
MVAKSYQQLPIISEAPFTQGGKGRMFVTVQLKDGRTKNVRWYSEAEYRKLYGIAATQMKRTKTQKEVLGFTEGYITIYKGATFQDKDFFSEEPNCRYHKLWKWYTVSTEDLPVDIPEHITPVKLPWEMVGSPEGNLYDDTTVETAVSPLLYEADVSSFQGEVGERIEREVTITRVIETASNYGIANMHVMRDNEHNCYIWFTTAKSLLPNRKYIIKGTVKAHKSFRMTQQTILTRCYTTLLEEG